MLETAQPALSIQPHRAVPGGRSSPADRPSSCAAGVFPERLPSRIIRAIVVLILVAGACLTCSTSVHGQTAPPVEREVWFRIDYDDQPAGYEHLTSRVRQTQLPDGTTRQQIQRHRRTELTLTRFGRDLSVSSTLTTLESAEGHLLQWSLTRQAGDGSRTDRSGVWNAEDTLYDITEVQQATRRNSRLPCTALPWSPMIAAWSGTLLQQPATRTRRDVLFPESNSIVSVRFERKPPQSIQLRTGERVNVAPLVVQPQSAPQLVRTLYFSQAGDILRSVQHVLGRPLVLERSEAAQALAASGVGSLDVDTQALIPVNRQISQMNSRAVTRLRVIPLRGNAIDIPAFAGQQVEPQSDGSVIVTIHRPRYPEESTTAATTIPPNIKRFLMPTDLLDFESDAVRVLTLRAGGPIDGPLDQSRRMTRYLFTNLRRSRFSTSLVPAGQIAESMRGDCTEHATLLAAMMRSRGIPARVATGLVYVERVSAFTSHMWTEAYIDGEWFPFDSATGAKGTGADRIKLADSTLDFPPSGAVSLFLPLLPLLNDTKIELLSDQPDGFGR